jgi:transposase InsO family protein
MAYPLLSKAKALSHLQAFVNRLDRQLPVKVKCFRSDQGVEFTNGAALQRYLRLGLVHQTSPRYNPEINGVVKRFNRTVKDMSGAMAVCTPLSRCWDQGIRYACVGLLDKTTTGGSGKTA